MDKDFEFVESTLYTIIKNVTNHSVERNDNLFGYKVNLDPVDVVYILQVIENEFSIQIDDSFITHVNNLTLLELSKFVVNKLGEEVTK